MKSLFCVTSIEQHERAVPALAEVLRREVVGDARARCPAPPCRSSGRLSRIEAAGSRARRAPRSTSTRNSAGAFSISAPQRAPSVWVRPSAAATARFRRREPGFGTSRCPASASTAGSSVVEPQTREEHRERGADAHHAEERDADDQQAEERDDHRHAGEDDGGAGGRDRLRQRDLDRHVERELIPIAGDDEEAVVDADREAEHQREGEAGARDVDEVRGEQQRRRPTAARRRWR